MKIILIGYGKMGKAIEKEANIKGHDIVLTIKKTKDIKILEKYNFDVIIEFSNPQSAFENIKKCLEYKKPIICGTTGWLEKYNDIIKICKIKDGTLLYSSNFSIGMNIFFNINNRLSYLINKYYNNYNIEIEEIHHKKKIDLPSGSSISLANNIKKNINNINGWVLNKTEKNKINIKSKRENNIVGTHIINYILNMDKIKIKHEAKDRKIFAIGTIIASEWIIGKKGIFSMKDVINI